MRTTAAVTALIFAMTLSATTAHAEPAGPVSTADVIVQAKTPDAVQALKKYVKRQEQGDVNQDADLSIVNGFEATVPASSLDALFQQPGVMNIVENGDVGYAPPPSGTDTNGLSDVVAGPPAPGGHKAKKPPAAAPGMATHSPILQSSDAVSVRAAGTDGSGVAVAVLDTGVQNADPLGKVAVGVDVSKDQRTRDGRDDGFGHGTTMAGVIGQVGNDKNGKYAGIAPGVKLVPVKVAASDGSTTPSQMLQGMSWISEHAKAQNIRVVNLSWGILASDPVSAEPIYAAVAELWREGIVVVVSAGNEGPGANTVTAPGNHPTLLTVGAYSDGFNADPSDDSVPDWASRGWDTDNATKPDVVAPGVGVVSARSIGSKIERDNPGAVIGADYIRGAGASQATAVVSGAAALLLQQRPDLTPDQVKALFMGTASPIPDATPDEQGAGRVDVAKAVAARAIPPLPSYQLDYKTCAATSGDCGTLWAGSRWGDGVWAGSRWGTDMWDGSRWGGSRWGGSRWGGSRWGGSRWGGSRWGAASW